MSLKCDGVFEGGGVKGVGLAGAVSAIENAGYSFQNMAGTSAGAIVASLLAVGYKGAELENIIKTLDFKKFKEESFLDKFGMVGKIMNVTQSYGIYKCDYFEDWLNILLKKKGKTTFGQIKTGSKEDKYKYKFQAIASDLTDNKLLILPNSLIDFGIDPDGFSIAKAVRMSMSIPIFFEPYRLIDNHGREHIISDGGLLSNYPIWLLDDGTNSPEWPTFGFKFAENKINAENKPIDSMLEYTKSVISTLLEAHDNLHISMSKGDFQRTIQISTEICVENKYSNISTTYFEITEEEKDLLIYNGKVSAEKFLENWNFEKWKWKYRR